MAVNIVPVLVGHPFAPIGMGEHIRCSYRAFRSVAVKPLVCDIYRLNAPEEDWKIEFSDCQTSTLGRVNIFHINGDEVSQVLNHLPQFVSLEGYNVCYPAWELAKYPNAWAKELNRFDEIWAPSRFIQDSISAAVDRLVIHMPLACDVILSSFLGRRYFGIPESSYAFLFFFDFRSYTSRKNPRAVIEAFMLLLRHRPGADVCLVLKLNGAENYPTEAADLQNYLARCGGRIKIIDGTLTDNETKNLVRCCDSFVSLHRSEGYGRGLAEAMYLGKPVIATAYSGNLDFMNKDNSLLVDYRLVPLEPDSYPHWQGQSWADPDVEQASHYMVQLIDDPDLGRVVGQRASRRIRVEFGYRATGLRYRNRLEEIQIADR